MSDNAKENMTPISDTVKIMKVVIDCSQDDADGTSGLTAAVHPLNAYLPKFHKVVDCEFAVETAGASGGSATVSVGIDDTDSEPDNLLNDEAIASFATLTSEAGAVVNGIPRFGTDATHVQVGASDAQLAYEVKDAALTALKITAIITLVPTK